METLLLASTCGVQLTHGNCTASLPMETALLASTCGVQPTHGNCTVGFLLWSLEYPWKLHCQLMLVARLVTNIAISSRQCQLPGEKLCHQFASVLVTRWQTLPFACVGFHVTNITISLYHHWLPGDKPHHQLVLLLVSKLQTSPLACTVIGYHVTNITISLCHHWLL